MRSVRWTTCVGAWLLAVTFATCGAGAASAAPSTPPTATLTAVACPSVRGCLAVGQTTSPSGDQGAMAEWWNGSAWSMRSPPLPTGATQDALNSVACSPRGSCMAVGFAIPGEDFAREFPLVERFRQSRWTVQETPLSSDHYTYLVGVACPAARMCVVVGHRLSTGGVIEMWNGRRWRLVRTPLLGLGGGYFTGVACSTPDACVASGAAYTGQILIERWDGHHWSVSHAPDPGNSDNLPAAACPSPVACLVVGDAATPESDRPVVERLAGTKWSLTPVFTSGSWQGSALSAVACTAVAACTAVGFFDTATTGAPLAERWNGSRWALQATPEGGAPGVAACANPDGCATGGRLNGVACPAMRVCIAVGGYGDGSGAVRPLGERWNGQAWTAQATVDPLNGTANSPSTPLHTPRLKTG